MSGSLAATLTALALGANLVDNPGFEERGGDAPSAWQSFVLPQDGAFGRLSNEAYEGAFSAMLHIPEAYARDPLNNWSQNVSGRVAGERLELRAYVRTEAAGEALLWLQCWQRQPLRVVAFASTAEGGAIAGDQPWTEVRAAVDAPASTDFVTVRCILRGSGTAWFDAVQVYREGDEPEPFVPNDTDSATESEGPSPDDTAAGDASPAGTDRPADTARDRDANEIEDVAAGAPASPTQAASGDADRPVSEATPDRTEGSPSEPETPGLDANRFERLADDVRLLRQGNRYLSEALESVERENAALLAELVRLREELERLRAEARAVETPLPPVPPLVPRAPTVPETP